MTTDKLLELAVCVVDNDCSFLETAYGVISCQDLSKALTHVAFASTRSSRQTPRPLSLCVLSHTLCTSDVVEKRLKSAPLELLACREYALARRLQVSWADIEKKLERQRRRRAQVMKRGQRGGRRRATADKTEMRKCFAGRSAETERNDKSSRPVFGARGLSFGLCARVLHFNGHFGSAGFLHLLSWISRSPVLIFKSSRKMCALFAHQLRFPVYTPY